MADDLTPDEQRAIAAYTGPVTRYETGDSSFVPPVWTGHRLVQQCGAKEAKRRFGQRHWAKRKDKRA